MIPQYLIPVTQLGQPCHNPKALYLPVSVAVIGVANIEQLKANVEIVKQIRPMNVAEREELERVMGREPPSYMDLDGHTRLKPGNDMNRKHNKDTDQTNSNLLTRGDFLAQAGGAMIATAAATASCLGGQSTIIRRHKWKGRKDSNVKRWDVARTMDKLAAMADIIVPGHDNYFLVDCVV